MISPRLKNLYEVLIRVRCDPVQLTSEVALPDLARDRLHGVYVSVRRVTIGERKT